MSYGSMFLADPHFRKADSTFPEGIPRTKPKRSALSGQDSTELRFTKNLPKGRYLGNCPYVVISQVMVILEIAHIEDMGNIIQVPPCGHIYMS